MKDLEYVIEDLIIKIEMRHITVGIRDLETNGLFMVKMLGMPSHVSWWWGGRIDMCKGDNRRGEPSDRCGVSCASAGNRVECRRMRGQVCRVLILYCKREWLGMESGRS